MRLNDFSRPNLIVLFLTTVLHAQSSSPSTPTLAHFEFERIGLTDGLPSEYVNCIAQDRFGFMWFGTKNGLCRYDGRKFKTYKTIDGDSTSLAGNDIQVLFSDSRGILWVGANGLNRFDFDLDNFTRIAPANKLKFVAELCEDNAGNLWLGTYGQGLFKFDPVSERITQIDLGERGPNRFAGNSIFSLATDGSDTLWITGNNQVIALNTQTGRRHKYFAADYLKLFIDRAGRFWLGGIGKPLAQMQLPANGAIAFTHFERIVSKDLLACFQDDRNGNLWISTVKQLFDEAVADLLTAFSEQIAIALKNAYVFSDLKKSHQQLANELRANYKFDNIIGSSPAMTKILQLVAQVADTDTTVLIEGENGTGKELIARALHYNSSRRDKPFVAVNCGAIPENLIESELFGHEKGAFTGAINRKQGKFESADGGAIFLDEIGEMTPAMQVKLLRVLQDGTFSPVGSAAEKQCDVRVIAATNRELKKMLADKTFREVLYYRLNVINLTVPPLRDRREDLLLLIAHFLRKYSKSDQPPRLSKAAEQILLDYDYPGNVRQLENVMQRAVILCKGENIETQHLPEDLQAAGIYHEADPQTSATFQERKQRVIEKFERDELTAF